MNEPLPIPDDFLEHQHETLPQLCARYGRHKSTIGRWKRKLGVAKCQPWTLAQKLEVKELIQQGYTAAQIADRVGRGRKGVIHGVQEYGLGPWIGSRARNYEKRPCPSDFAERWSQMVRKQLCAHYKASGSVISRWTQELNLRRPAPQPVVRNAPVRQVRSALITSATVKRQGADFRFGIVPFMKQNGPADVAAMWLRTDGWPVHRCRADGTVDQGGNYWRCGRVICDDAELIERGERAKRRRAA